MDVGAGGGAKFPTFAGVAAGFANHGPPVDGADCDWLPYCDEEKFCGGKAWFRRWLSAIFFLFSSAADRTVVAVVMNYFRLPGTAP